MLQTYRNLLTKLPNGTEHLEKAYEAIENKISEVRNYVDEWLRYQSLWDLQADTLYGRLGEDINLWIKCLNDIKYVHFFIKTLFTFRIRSNRRKEINESFLLIGNHEQHLIHQTLDVLMVQLLSIMLKFKLR